MRTAFPERRSARAVAGGRWGASPHSERIRGGAAASLADHTVNSTRLHRAWIGRPAFELANCAVFVGGCALTPHEAPLRVAPVPSEAKASEPTVGAYSLGACGDFDRDGCGDYALLRGEERSDGGWECRVVLRSGRDDAWLAQFELGVLPQLAWTHVCGDLDGDGRSEFATSWRELRVLSGVDGALLYAEPGVVFCARCGDYDGDGKREFYVRSLRANSALLEGVRSLDGTPPADAPDLREWIAGVLCGDLDGDGFDDAARRLEGGGVGVVSGRDGRLAWRLGCTSMTGLNAVALASDADAGAPTLFIAGCAERSWGTELHCERARAERVLAPGAIGLATDVDPGFRGWPVACVGDVDGDGVGDGALGLSLCAPAGHIEGVALGLIGSRAGRPLWRTERRYSACFAALPDRDGDGVLELVTCVAEVVVLSGRTGAVLSRYRP